MSRDVESTATRPWRRTVLIGLACAVLGLTIGVVVGTRSPWGVQHPHVAHGVAVRANSENDLVMFDADDGTQIDFGLNHMWWESESQAGDGDPPCLRTPHRKVEVDIGFMRIAGPNGGWRMQAMWVKCP